MSRLLSLSSDQVNSSGAQLTESVRLPSRRHDRTDPRRGSSEPVGYGSGGGGARGGDLGTRFWRLNARAVTAATTAATITNPTAKPRGRRDPELGDPLPTCCWGCAMVRWGSGG